MSQENNSSAWVAYSVFATLYVLLIGGLLFAIPVFADMFADFGAELPKPTQMAIDLSWWINRNFLVSLVIILIPLVGGYMMASNERDESSHSYLWIFAGGVFVLILALAGAIYLPFTQGFQTGVVGQ